MTIGERLRAAREAKGLSIGDIARRTFIQVKFLQAIDRDDFSAIPVSHRMLFVREYAKVAGVDPNEVLPMLEEYQAPEPVVVPEPAAPPPTRKQRKAAAPPPPPVASGGEPVSEAERKEYKAILRRLSAGKGVKLSGPNTSSWLIGIAIVLLMLAALYYLVFMNNGTEAEMAATPSGTDTTAGQAEILSGDTTSVAEVAAEREAGDSLTLEGEAVAKVWFSIVMDGKRSDTGTLDSGEVRTWRAMENFKLSLGNAGGLLLTLNDSTIGALGPKQSIIRSQIIDASGVQSRTVTRRSASTAAPSRSSGATRDITPAEVRPPATRP